MRALALASVGVIAAGAVVVGVFEPTTSAFFPACPLLTYTGYACPGCGLTRGFHALFHGDVLAALDYNALIPVWICIFSYLIAAALAFGFRGRVLSIGSIRPVWLFALLALVVTFGVVRNVPAYPFSILFP